jgi:hypothetical protein
MEIRRSQPSDARAIAGILLPVFREGSTYAIDPDISEADALAYWLAADKDTFLAEDAGTIVGTSRLRGRPRHVPDAHRALMNATRSACSCAESLRSKRWS